MEKIKLPAALMLLAACGMGTGALAANGQRPNVIIILADDVGYGDVSCNGSKTISTPNVDRLAAEGVRFTNAHTTAATSTPARYSLLTGQYPWRKKGTGVATGDAGMIISPGQYTIADMFKGLGYATGVIGKWHLGLGETGKQDWNGVITPYIDQIGFDYSYIIPATGDRVPCVWVSQGRVVGLDPADPISVSYTTPFPGEPTGKDNPELLRLKPSYTHDNAIVNGISRIGYMKGGKAALWVDEQIGDVITEKSVAFIDRNAKKPFFLYLCTHDIHVPRVPNPRFVGKSGMGARGDAILEFDYTVGKVLDALDRNGLSKNTIVILSSDNGPVTDDGYQDGAITMLGNHKPWWIYRGGKYSIYEAGTRVPMIVRWGAQIKKPMVQDALVCQVDILASLASLMGVEIPQNGAPDSRNSLATLLGRSKSGREYVVEQNSQGTLSILMPDGWKYIEPSTSTKVRSAFTGVEYGNSPEPQLYMVLKDPGETTDLASSNPEKVRALAAKLQQIQASPYTGGKN